MKRKIFGTLAVLSILYVIGLAGSMDNQAITFADFCTKGSLATGVFMFSMWRLSK